MKPHLSLSASADIAEQAGRLSAARFFREMARDALAMETHFPGSSLYTHWARDIAERASAMTIHREPVSAQQAAGRNHGH